MCPCSRLFCSARGALASRQGMKTLREDGVEKARQGLTTLAEVARVLYGADGAPELGAVDMAEPCTVGAAASGGGRSYGSV